VSIELLPAKLVLPCATHPCRVNRGHFPTDDAVVKLLWLAIDPQTLAELFASGTPGWSRTVTTASSPRQRSTTDRTACRSTRRRRPCFNDSTGLARVLRRDGYRPVALSGRYQECDGAHTVVSADVAEARGRAFPSMVVVGSATREAWAHPSATGEITRGSVPRPQPIRPGPVYLALVACSPPRGGDD
jgi:hypothetical protein